jgi:drug/metabolite transporter (DMT)-like permease
MWCHVTAVGLTVAANSVAVRQTSLLMGVGFGYLIFKEKNIRTRFFGSAIMVLGICLLTLS